MLLACRPIGSPSSDVDELLPRHASMRPTRRIAVTITALFLAVSPGAAHAYSALYVFGDSLSDAGNDFIATGGAEPAAPYADGQFSNGPIWAQDLSQSLGLGSLAPLLAGGSDYAAFGGATTGACGHCDVPGSAVPTANNTDRAVRRRAPGPVAPSTALYSVWIGSNDLLNILAGGTSGLTAISLAQQAAQTEATDIAGLAGIGAKDFLNPHESDLGAAPVLTSQGIAASTGGNRSWRWHMTLRWKATSQASPPRPGSMCRSSTPSAWWTKRWPTRPPSA